MRSPALPALGSVVGTARSYVALTKPNIIWLLLVTTIPAMVVANGGWPSTGRVAATISGGTLAAGGANAINQFAERDIDAQMARTRKRPLVAGTVAPRNAAVFGVVLGVLAAAWLLAMVNTIAALLTVGAILVYVPLSTYYLKRTTVHNGVMGCAARAGPGGKPGAARGPGA